MHTDSRNLVSISWNSSLKFDKLPSKEPNLCLKRINFTWRVKFLWIVVSYILHYNGFNNKQRQAFDVDACQTVTSFPGPLPWLLGRGLPTPQYQEATMNYANHHAFIHKTIQLELVGGLRGIGAVSSRLLIMKKLKPRKTEPLQSKSWKSWN